MIYIERPDDFNEVNSVVGCYIEVDGEILLLQRQANKKFPNEWGLPAGKVDENEDLFSAILREVFEETGINIDIKDLKTIKPVFVRFPEFDVVWNEFRVVLKNKPEVKLSESEHQKYVWIRPVVAVKELDLMFGQRERLLTLYVNENRFAEPKIK